MDHMVKKWLCLAYLGLWLFLAGWIFVAAAGMIRPMDRADCAAAEFHLRQMGQDVRVESGTLHRGPDQVRAVLMVRPRGQGPAVEMVVPFGPRDNRDTLAGRWPAE
jgi:hypothetical protein